MSMHILFTQITLLRFYISFGRTLETVLDFSKLGKIFILPKLYLSYNINTNCASASPKQIQKEYCTLILKESENVLGKPRIKYPDKIQLIEFETLKVLSSKFLKLS